MASEDTGSTASIEKGDVFIPPEQTKKLQETLGELEKALGKDAEKLGSAADALEQLGNVTSDMSEGLWQILEMMERELSSIPPDQLTSEQKKELAELRQKKAQLRKDIDASKREWADATGSNVPKGSEKPTAAAIPAGFKQVDIPQIGGSISIPESWSAPTSGQMKESIGLIVPPDGIPAEELVKAMDQFAGNGFAATKLPEPTDQPQTALIVFWTPKPPALDVPGGEALGASLVLEHLKQGMGRLQKGNRNFVMSKEPSLIDRKGTGAWVEYKTDVLTKKGQTYTVTKRLYMLIGKRNLIIVTLGAAGGDEAGLKELWQAFSTFRYAK